VGKGTVGGGRSQWSAGGGGSGELDGSGCRGGVVLDADAEAGDAGWEKEGFVGVASLVPSQSYGDGGRVSGRGAATVVGEP
jgi:hypothetical protein